MPITKAAHTARWPVMSDADYLAKMKARTIVNEHGCWEWQGFLHHNGYGEMSCRHKTWRVHRLAFRLSRGTIDMSLDVCHSCDNRKCCNPDHLWQGTRKQNIRDCVEKGRQGYQKRTHCPKGHEYNEENTYVIKSGRTKGGRGCKACQRGKNRVTAGWPKDLAYSLPAQALGYTVNPNHPRNATTV